MKISTRKRLDGTIDIIIFIDKKIIPFVVDEKDLKDEKFIDFEAEINIQV